MRVPVPWLAAALLLAPHSLADEIHHMDGSRPEWMEVEITAIDARTVEYRFLAHPESLQSEDMRRVDRVVFTIVPAEFASGEARFARGEFASAAASYRRAMEDRTRNRWVDPVSLARIAECRSRLGDRVGALGAYEDLLTRFPDTHLVAEVSLARVRLLEADDRPEEARSALQAFLVTARRLGLPRRESLRARMALHALEAEAGDLATAARGFARIAEEAGTGAEDLCRQARLAWARCATPSEALAAFEALASDPTCEPAIRGAAWGGIAALRFDRGEFHEALLASLRVLTMYAQAAPGEVPRSTLCAAACFHVLRDRGETWESRAATLAERLRLEHPDSPWARASYRNPPRLAVPGR